MSNECRRQNRGPGSLSGGRGCRKWTASGSGPPPRATVDTWSSRPREGCACAMGGGDRLFLRGGVHGADRACRGAASSVSFMWEISEHTKWLLLFLGMTLMEDNPPQFHCRNGDQLQVTVTSCLPDRCRGGRSSSFAPFAPLQDGCPHLAHILDLDTAPVADSQRFFC